MRASPSSGQYETSVSTGPRRSATCIKLPFLIVTLPGSGHQLSSIKASVAGMFIIGSRSFSPPTGAGTVTDVLSGALPPLRLAIYTLQLPSGTDSLLMYAGAPPLVMLRSGAYLSCALAIPSKDANSAFSTVESRPCTSNQRATKPVINKESLNINVSLSDVGSGLLALPPSLTTQFLLIYSNEKVMPLGGGGNI